METASIIKRITPALAELGLECLGVEWSSGSGGGLLRVYIDAPVAAGAAANAVGVDECEKASREISALLDVDDAIPGRYVLEVSSPGIERPLFSAEQFARFIGQEAQVTLRLPRDGRRRFRGHIAAVTGAQVDLAVEGGHVAFAMNEVEGAHLVPDWEALGYAPKPKPGKASKTGAHKRRR